MSSPRVGVVRDSMLTNPLLIKASLGHSRSRGLSRPGPDFVYGDSSTVRDGGVAEVLSSWRVQSGSGSCRPRRPDPDFVSLNRDGVRLGLVTARELSQYRAQRQSSAPKRPQPPSGRTARCPAVPDITFGIGTKPSSPLSDLLSHQFARRWLDEQQLRNPTSSQQQLKSKPGCIPDTRTSLLRRSRALPHTHTPFTLPRFREVAPALDTFRTRQARPGTCGAPGRGAPGAGPAGLDGPLS
ncbi:cilia- and flagella-associated protein 77 [Myripristis murdjan]|uniref:cilia- and flagella-associated protein 77 n=1 Tax=Myripristis murdjan TaxID=586833 RepID=UPI001175D50B|nr:cilia- and flagella-associated protein 77 [Myripristis murdjan]